MSRIMSTRFRTMISRRSRWCRAGFAFLTSMLLMGQLIGLADGQETRKSSPSSGRIYVALKPMEVERVSIATSEDPPRVILSTPLPKSVPVKRSSLKPVSWNNPYQFRQSVVQPAVYAASSQDSGASQAVTTRMISTQPASSGTVKPVSWSGRPVVVQQPVVSAPVTAGCGTGWSGAPPTVTAPMAPGVPAAGVVAADTVPMLPGTSLMYRPVITLRPMPASYVVGRGLIGQPTVYVPGQPVRNFLRYISP